MASLAIWVVLAALSSHTAATTITGLPSQTDTSTYSATGGASLAPVSYSYTYTVTTPTTVWAAPTFTPDASVPSCTDSMCPSQNGGNCVDSQGVSYGILCDTRFSGIVITTSGKKFLLEREEDMKQLEVEEMYGAKEKRDYAGTFDNCAGFCDTYDKAFCGGVGYDGGYCMAYDTVTGTFSSTNGMAALRQ